MIMICMAVIPWITYMKVVKLDSTASEYFQNSDGLSVDFFLYYKALVVIFLGVLIACFIIGENIFPDNIIKETPVRSKSNRIMVFAAGIFIIMTVLSAIFSHYHATVRTGSPSEYESICDCIIYVVISWRNELFLLRECQQMVKEYHAGTCNGDNCPYMCRSISQAFA